MVLDLLAEDNDAHSALRTCSLVCHEFIPICRKHIFGSIVLYDYSPTPHPFEHLLHETPDIADYIRKFELESDYNVQFTSIQESLKRIYRLEFLTVWHPKSREFNWSNHLIHPALLHLLHLPTLTHFKVTNIDNFIISDLIPCIDLKYLDISFYMSVPVAAENSFPQFCPSIQSN